MDWNPSRLPSKHTSNESCISTCPQLDLIVDPIKAPKPHKRGFLYSSVCRAESWSWTLPDSQASTWRLVLLYIASSLGAHSRSTQGSLAIQARDPVLKRVHSWILDLDRCAFSRDRCAGSRDGQELLALQRFGDSTTQERLRVSLCTVSSEDRGRVR